jgi:excisionase family DNA binding protein
MIGLKDWRAAVRNEGGHACQRSAREGFQNVFRDCRQPHNLPRSAVSRSMKKQPAVPMISTNATSDSAEAVLLTKKEMAQRYSVNLATIDRWMASKRIPYYRFSPRMIRFNPADCDAALERFKVRSRA